MYTIIIISIFFLLSELHASEFSIAASSNQKIPIVICFLGQSKSFKELGITLEKDLSFSGQCSITVQEWANQKVTKDAIKALYDAGYVLALFINKKGHYFEWRLYDTIDQSLTMLAGKRYHRRGACTRAWAHAIADAVWPIITGNTGFFSTKLAYCQDALSSKGHRITHVYIADYDGSHSELLVDTPTINIAPRWNHDTLNPLLFYSEHTNYNLRLMVVNMKKRAQIASDFDGINMLPTFSADGKCAVYCASRGGGQSHLYRYDSHTFKKITINNGNNVSPTLSADGSIVYFCSDYETGYPQIYAYTFETDQYKRLTQGGYCASPCYSSAANKIVYCKIIKGITQLCVYDCATKKHAQITYDEGHKEECAWSPCGNYIVFAHKKNEKSVLVIMNMLTSQCKIVSDSMRSCSYPTWSPLYQRYPVVLC